MVLQLICQLDLHTNIVKSHTRTALAPIGCIIIGLRAHLHRNLFIRRVVREDMLISLRSIRYAIFSLGTFANACLIKTTNNTTYKIAIKNAKVPFNL